MKKRCYPSVSSYSTPGVYSVQDMTGEIPQTPEALMDLPWEVVDTPEAAAKVEKIKVFALSNGLVVPDNLKALQGGGVLRPAKGSVENPKDQEYLEKGRPIAIIPARGSKDAIEFDRLIFYPTQEMKDPKYFDANLAGYKIYAKFVGETLRKLGITHNPLTEAISVHALENGRFAVVTEFRKGLKPLGAGGPAEGIHRLDIKQLSVPGAIRRLIEALDSVHLPTKDYRQWTGKAENAALLAQIPATSWNNPDLETDKKINILHFGGSRSGGMMNLPQMIDTESYKDLPT